MCAVGLREPGLSRILERTWLIRLWNGRGRLVMLLRLFDVEPAACAGRQRRVPPCRTPTFK